jgi:hypothetical protein
MGMKARPREIAEGRVEDEGKAMQDRRIFPWGIRPGFLIPCKN